MFSLEDNANCNLSKRETPMLQLSRLPQNVSYFLRGTQHFFRFRHHLVFSWTLILLLVYQDKATLHGLSRMGPNHICEWHLRRLLCAFYWCFRAVLWWFVEAVLAVPPPAYQQQPVVFN